MPATCVRCALWRESSTAANGNALSRRFKITHPFHPWSGQEFDLVTHLHTWGEDRVYFQRKESEHLVSVPAIWTDVVPQDSVVQLAAGRSLFRIPDLLELVQMGERSRQTYVKEITP
ncbi:MAG TPA: DUF5372 family protein [Candidatus Methylomirabilis sp.]|nr:DUF5372 family protein [Candidatus Methylomirabilis sp.]